MSQKNVMHQLGWTEFTDEDYRNTFGIPEGQDINKFMFEKSERDNYNHYISELGMSEKDARAKAKQRTKEAKSQLAKKGVKF